MRQIKLNISQGSNGIEAIVKQNKVYDAFDGIGEKDPEKFAGPLVL